MIDAAMLIAMPRDVRLRIEPKKAHSVRCALCEHPITPQTASVCLPDAGPKARRLPAHIDCAKEKGWITH